MPRFYVSLLFLFSLLLSSTSARGSSLVAGTCMPKLPSYPTISAAVAAAPAGATVLVCPGTYAEQVVITQQLLLEGVTSANGDQAIITVPAGGLAPNVTSIGNTPFATQIAVIGADVTLTNLTIDGIGNNVSSPNWLAGVFYATGSSGLMNQLTVRNEMAGGVGNGIWAENGDPNVQSVTIENCSVHDFDYQGIFVAGNEVLPAPNFSVTMKSNHVTAKLAGTLAIVYFFNSMGSATSNVVVGPWELTNDESQGLTLDAAVTASSNSVSEWEAAFVDFGPATQTANTVVGTGNAFYFATDGATAQSNTIAQTGSAFVFLCFNASVSRNTVDDAIYGLFLVPSSFNMTNSFFNVNTIRLDGCSDVVGRNLASAANTKKPVVGGLRKN